MTQDELAPYFIKEGATLDTYAEFEHFAIACEDVCHDFAFMLYGIVTPALSKGNTVFMPQARDTIPEQMLERHISAGTRLFDLMNKHGLHGPIYPVFLPTESDLLDTRLVYLTFVHKPFWAAPK